MKHIGPGLVPGTVTAVVAVTVFEAVSTGIVTTPAAPADTDSGNGSGGPPGIGGCTISTTTQTGKPDPLFPLLLIGLLVRALR